MASKQSLLGKAFNNVDSDAFSMDVGTSHIFFSAFVGGGTLSDTTDLTLKSACIITIIAVLSNIDVFCGNTTIATHSSKRVNL
jgi:hypothetical protein